MSDKCPCRTNVHKISYRFSDGCLCRTNVRVGQMSGYPVRPSAAKVSAVQLDNLQLEANKIGPLGSL